MNRRMTMVTAIFGLVLLGISGCGKDEAPKEEPTASETTTTATPTTPTPEPTIDDASDLEGDWQDVDAKWVVHFHDDGTFVEDFDGQKDFRVGKYKVEGTTVSLIGDDGNTDPGKIEGEALKFKLGTLTRMS